MEKGGEYMNESNAATPLPSDIGRDFAKAFYKMWSVKQNDVFQFYGPDSFFSHDGHEAKGKDEIRKAIDELAYVDCKTRVHSVSGVNGANESCVLQVCGEMALNNNPPRRFIEVFVLLKHSAKSYFVQNDIFQWLDKAFAELPPQNDGNSAVEDANKTETSMQAPMEEPQQNGHSNMQTLSDPIVTNLPDLSSLTTETVQNKPPITLEENIPDMDNGGYEPTPENAAPVNNIFSESKNAGQRSYNETKQAEVPPPPPEPQHPKTWARAVGNSTGYQGGVKTIQPQQPTSTGVDDGNAPKDAAGNQPHDYPNKQFAFKDKRGGGAYNNGGFRGNYQRGSQGRGGATGGRGGGGYRNNSSSNFYRGNSGPGAGSGPAPQSGGPRFNGERRSNYENNRSDFRRSNQPAPPPQNKS
ncbi:nuclear transport factor 2 (NTF2) domain-containing protein [Ditylenchus destructor]|uniref:Nuclear transport factor 2 (NTF2) domain-containing protein n=1 Tax=Ditylenchus destructor TaxID=166010 RepID=A0AAD4N331_9BILA|nr:nuclear transport factor 2 (NTF2) domain-containing protein [Ditylenchus destructor]